YDRLGEGVEYSENDYEMLIEWEEKFKRDRIPLDKTGTRLDYPKIGRKLALQNERIFFDKITNPLEKGRYAMQYGNPYEKKVLDALTDQK
ncbi:hypothetical protein N8865_01450, partial [Francisellaceae bacterium]|nr:hypothetical protein [Francisellaceae bacterium]